MEKILDLILIDFFKLLLKIVVALICPAYTYTGQFLHFLYKNKDVIDETTVIKEGNSTDNIVNWCKYVFVSVIIQLAIYFLYYLGIKGTDSSTVSVFLILAVFINGLISLFVLVMSEKEDYKIVK